jgi:signal transduction histidine kinase
MDAEEAELAVTVKRAEHDWAETAIEDTVPGIRPEDLPHIFEPFYTRKAEGKGSGLGFAIAREIIVRHHGEIVAETTDHGARFRILLPLAWPEETTDAA